MITCQSTADLLSALPHYVGFVPRDSIVVMGFTGNRSVGAIRLDLPGNEAREQLANVATVMLSAIRALPLRDGASSAPAADAPIDGVAIAVITSARFQNSPVPPWSTLAQYLRQHCHGAKLEIRDLACLAADGWARYSDTATPPGGHPLALLAATSIAADHSLSAVPLPQQHEIGALPSPDPVHVARVATELRRLRAAHPIGEGSGFSTSAGIVATPGALLPERERNAVHDSANALRATVRLSPARSARIIHTLASPLLWVGVALGIMIRPDRAAALLNDHATAESVRTLVTDPLLDARAPFPLLGPFFADIAAAFSERARLSHSRSRVRELIAACPATDQAPAIAFSAWVWWLSGTQSVAQRHIDRALATDSHDPVARTVAELIATPSLLPRESVPGTTSSIPAAR